MGKETNNTKDRLIVCEDINKKQRQQIKELKTSLEDMLHYVLIMKEEQEFKNYTRFKEKFKDFNTNIIKAKELII